jgi:hypothetical protein
MAKINDWTVPFFQWVCTLPEDRVFATGEQKYTLSQEVMERADLYCGFFGRPSFPSLWKLATGIGVPVDLIPWTGRTKKEILA